MPAEELRRARLMTKRAVEMNIPPWGTVCLCGAWQKAASGHFVAYGCPWLHSFRSGTYLDHVIEEALLGLASLPSQASELRLRILRAATSAGWATPVCLCVALRSRP